MSTPSVPSPLVADHAAPLTKQAVFDIAWRWSRTHPRCKEGGVCRYRSFDGLNACLVGATLPDSTYSTGMENVSAATLLVAWGRVKVLFHPEVGDTWLWSLQCCHDDEPSHVESALSYLDLITARLTRFAERNGLTIPTEG